MAEGTQTNIQIERLRDAVDAVYVAVEAKGGTVPEEKTVGNLPAAIQSIPSPDNFVDVLTYDDTASLSKLITGDNSGITEINDTNGVITTWKAGTMFKENTLTKIYLPSLTSLGEVGIFAKCPSLTELYLPECTTIYSSSAGVAFAQCNVEVVNLPKLTTRVGLYLLGGCKSKIVNLPSLTSIIDSNNGVLQGCSNLRRVYLPEMTEFKSNTDVRSAFTGCPNLIDIEFGTKITSSLSGFRGWSPTNALKSDSTSLVDEGETFSSNLEKLLYNIRTHIAAKLPDKTGQTALSITLSTNIKSAINNEVGGATAAAFTSKNWTIV